MITTTGVYVYSVSYEDEKRSEETRVKNTVTCQSCHTTHFVNANRCPKCRARNMDAGRTTRRPRQQQQGKAPMPTPAFMEELVGVKPKKWKKKFK